MSITIRRKLNFETNLLTDIDRIEFEFRDTRLIEEVLKNGNY